MAGDYGGKGVSEAYRKLYHKERYQVRRCLREIREEIMIAGIPECRMAGGRGTDGSVPSGDPPARRKVDPGTMESVMGPIRKGTCGTCRWWKDMGPASVCGRPPKMAAMAGDTCGRWER